LGIGPVQSQFGREFCKSDELFGHREGSEIPNYVNQVIDYENDNCDGRYVNDVLSEDTLDWYAQDNDGNIWYVGEDDQEFCDRNSPNMICSTEGSCRAGDNGAAPGDSVVELR